MEEPLPHIQPCLKRRTVTVPLTDEQEYDLVGWFRTNEIFYNHSLKDFKLKDKKERLVSDKAKEVNISLVELKTWLTSMWATYW